MLQRNSSTRPGSKIESGNYEVIFVAGHQLGIGCYLVEYERDWSSLMQIILSTLETVVNTSDQLRSALSEHIQLHSDIVLNDVIADISVEIDILDQNYFPLKQTKSLHVTFSDNFRTSLIFFIRRKQVLKSLKHVSLERLSELLNKTEAASELLKNNTKTKCLNSIEIPEMLKTDILVQSRNIWNQKHEQNTAMMMKKMSGRKMLSRDFSWRAAFQYLMI